MREEDDELDNPEEDRDILDSTVKRYEEMRKKRESYFFDVDALQRIIEHFIERIEFAKALEVARYGLKLHPGTILFKVKEAHLFALTGQEDKALEILAEAEAVSPYDIDLHLIRGNIYNSLERYQDAVNCYKQALELSDSQKDDIFLSLAIAHQNMADYSKAVDYYFRTLEENPDNEIAMEELLVSLEYSGRLDEGLRFFSKLIDDRPYHYTAWFYLGNLYNKLSLHEKALNAFDYAILIKEDFAPAHLDMAHTLSMLERFDDAISRYKAAFEYCQPDAFIYYNIGECYEQLEIYDEARVYYKKAVKMHPDMSQAWYGIGITLEGEERWYEAIHYIKKAIELDEMQSDYWYALADCQYRLKNYTDAEVCYQRAIDNDPENEEIWISFADMVAALNRPFEAIEMMNMALTYHPTSAELLYRLVCYLYMGGFIQEAYQQLDIALSVDYNQHEIIFELLPALEKDQQIMNRISNTRI
ncbi:MAG: tetratricopeptide repeat protein [Bacteroidota bacterium]